MRRAPGTSGSAAFSVGGALVALLAVVVIGGTVYGYDRWQSQIDEATAIDTASGPGAGKPSRTPLPAAPSSDDATPEQPAEPAYEPPTFEVLEPTDNRPQPVVLLVGDGYAAGRGASSAGTSYASLLARDLGWDIRIAAETGAGYVSAAPTLLDLFLDSPPSLDPDLVLVQGAYGSNAGNAEAKAAVEELIAAIDERYADTPVAVVTAFSPGGITGQAETRERTLARAWREDPDTLVLRPQIDGWSDVSPDDAGHELIATEIIDAFRTAGLAVGA